MSSQRISRGFHRLGPLIPFTAAFMFVSDIAAAVPVRCQITAKFVCQPVGCAPVELGSFNIIDTDLGTFSRCDSKGCDEYKASFSRSGHYVVIDLPGRGMVAKMSGNGAEYVEIVTLGIGTIVSYGACSQQ